ncbi:MAG TPA: hypothetical protein VN540_01285 [Clostridia bacterium]|nr:hypothetical protein [Clostridia bacterium]
MSGIYSGISIVPVEGFRMARYVIISPAPEDDVNAYMDAWAKKSGLFDVPGYVPRKIGWDFPFVTEEQQKNFGLRGYVAAYILPEGFEPACPGAEIAQQAADTYAKITITDPFFAPFERIPPAYQMIMAYNQENGLGPHSWEGRICFEEVREENGVTYMDVYFPADAK